MGLQSGVGTAGDWVAEKVRRATWCGALKATMWTLVSSLNWEMERALESSEQKSDG